MAHNVTEKPNTGVWFLRYMLYAICYMLYLFHGTDTKKAHDKAYGLAQSLLQKKPDASLFSLGKDEWNRDRIAELLQSHGLFMANYIVFVDMRPFLVDDVEILLSYAKEIKESPHIFIVLGEKIDKKTLKEFEKCSQKIQDYSFSVEEEKKDFRMTDALGNRDKKSLWVLYQEALRKGVEIEKIHGSLYWQIKNMLLALNSKNAEEAGMKAFPFSKARQSLKNYSAEEISELSFNFIDAYHKVRMGKGDLETNLERVILSL